MIAVVLLCVLSLLSHDVYGGARITKRQSQTIISRENMLRGIGGVTVVDVGNPSEQLLIQQDQSFRCHVDYATGIPQCAGGGGAARYTAKQPSDYCYASYYAAQSGQLCFPSNDFSTVRFIGNDLCQSDDGSPIYRLTEDEYKALCGIYPWDRTQRFYPASPIDLSQNNCLNSQGNFCEYKVKFNSPSTVDRFAHMSFNKQIQDITQTDMHTKVKNISVSDAFNQNTVNNMKVPPSLFGQIQPQLVPVVPQVVPQVVPPMVPPMAPPIYGPYYHG